MLQYLVPAAARWPTRPRYEISAAARWPPRPPGRPRGLRPAGGSPRGEQGGLVPLLPRPLPPSGIQHKKRQE